MARRRRGWRPSGLAFARVQMRKVRGHYGLSQEQLGLFFDEARRRPGNTGLTLLILCERRLDNAIYRAGLAASRAQARAAIARGHFQLDGQKAADPYYLAQRADVLEVVAGQGLHRRQLAKMSSHPPSWIRLEPEGLELEIVRLPEARDISLVVDIDRVVELLMRA